MQSSLWMDISQIMTELYLIAADAVEVAADIFTIIASGIAIWIFVFHRDTFKSVIRVLLNYAYQITLTELISKMDSLNDMNADDNDKRQEVINILNDIRGQLRGNKYLKDRCGDIVNEIDTYAGTRRKLTEANKRSLVSELRETLRHVDIEKYNQAIGEIGHDQYR